MGIKRCRGDALVAKQPLEEKQIDAFLQQERGGRMAKHVRRDSVSDSGRTGEMLQPSPK